MSSDPVQPTAVVLLGPTGCGKTPLGELLQARGLWGRPCVHFDFGAILRAVVARNLADAWVSRDDMAFLREVLRSGALLEDDRFPLALRILQRFLHENSPQPDAWVVLNGLPRHVGQARSLAAVLDIRAVVDLSCTAPTVLARLASNVGGDRAERVDDDPESVRRKLEIYGQRTEPLREHYRAAGIRIERLEVRPDSTPEAMWRELETRG